MQEDKDQFKCNLCNKICKDTYDLRRHKARKTPCVKVEVDNKTCNYCNKPYSSNYALNRHTKTCKSKDIEKLKNEISEKDKIIEKKDKTLEEYLQILLKENLELKEKLNSNTNNITNITNSTTNNFTINNYLTPDLSYMINKENLIESPFYKFFIKHLVQTPVELISAIYFDPARKENQSIKLINKREQKLEVMNEGRKTILIFSPMDLYKFRDHLYDTTLSLVKEVNPILSDIQKGVGKQINDNKDKSTQIELEAQKILTKLEDGRANQ